MTWFAGVAVKLVGATAVAALLSLGAVGVLAQSPPAESAKSVATKATPADKAARSAIAKAVFESEAAALGITPDALRADLKNGQKVSDLAKAKGWDKTAFGKQLLDKLTPRLKALVDTHVVQQAQADKTVDRIKKGHIPFWDGKHHRPKK
jgi:membrane-bound lytic murein transglycosylase B